MTGKLRTFGYGLATLIASAGTGMVATGPAQASSQAVGGFMSAVTLRCLDSNHAASVYTNPCGSGNDYQTWVVDRTPLGYQSLRNVATGRCLDGNSAGNVYTSPCDGYNQYQNWDLNLDSGTHMRSAATNRCLDSDHAGSVYTNGCDGGNLYQRWV